jgi:rubrerythrin
MAESKVVEVLKKAILLEQQGMNFYKGIAENSKSEAVKNIFTIMADEEKKHMDALTAQYKKYEKGGSFSFDEGMGSPNEFSDKVLSEKVRSEINAAGYEAASISAAIGLEKETINLYSSRAEETEDPDEKKIYNELVGWERTHVSFLNSIYNDLLEDSWYDQNFWPF